MTRHLVLCRHAKSDWSSAGQKDFDRPLNPRGHRDAPRMAMVLKNLGLHVDLFISSPAERARTTAIYYAETMLGDAGAILFDEEIYEASPRILLRAINALPENKYTVCMFGHNPTFTHMIEYLSGAEIGNLPTSGIAHLEFEDMAWAEIGKNSGVLAHFEYPKKHYGDEQE